MGSFSNSSIFDIFWENDGNLSVPVSCSINCLKTKNPDNLHYQGFFGAPSRDQTSDLLITSQLLYQLSYGGVPYFRGAKVAVLTISRNFFVKKTTKLHALFSVGALNQRVAFVPQ